MPTLTVCPPSTPVGPSYQARTVTVLLPGSDRPTWTSLNRAVHTAIHEWATGWSPVFQVPPRGVCARILRRPDRVLARVRTTTRTSWCAGGRKVDLLAGISRMRAVAQDRAVWDYAYWQQVVAGTPTALTLSQIRDRRHGKNLPQDALVREYEMQPRVVAMRLANIDPRRQVTLDEENLPLLQTNADTYTRWQVMAAVPGDEVITLDGTFLYPRSDRFDHRMEYLQQANSHIDRLAGKDWMVQLRRAAD
ncbi:hypothetical protein [Actinocatenispora rupis]|uniref:Uncharacterized protein n=1 Tax=Actinocatenispora rupis TaxID=519421 RepID=A0A8J3J8A3_9ACTN|nr:hypothetical protein [Actinocatenispora rupis]GID10218.1 hypothetical protein Aru02nite_11070 [Actinocatenispora rupis]